MFETKKASDGVYEKWRNIDLKKLTQEEKTALNRDYEISNQIWRSHREKSGLTDEVLRMASASLIPLKSSYVSPTEDGKAQESEPTLKTSGSATLRPSNATTSPSSLSPKDTLGSDIINAPSGKNSSTDIIPTNAANEKGKPAENQQNAIRNAETPEDMASAENTEPPEAEPQSAAAEKPAQELVQKAQNVFKAQIDDVVSKTANRKSSGRKTGAAGPKSARQKHENPCIGEKIKVSFICQKRTSIRGEIILYIRKTY